MHYFPLVQLYMKLMLGADGTMLFILHISKHLSSLTDIIQETSLQLCG